MSYYLKIGIGTDDMPAFIGDGETLVLPQINIYSGADQYKIGGLFLE